MKADSAYRQPLLPSGKFIGKGATALLLAATLIATLIAGVCSEAQAGFGFRKPITIQGSQVRGTLPDFAVLVSITDPDLAIETRGGHVISNQGHDIVFRAADGVTPLAHEVEDYNATDGRLLAWVKVPALSAGVNTKIYLYYGDSSITAPTENPAGVWDSSYRAVWHLSNDDFSDSTAYGNDATNNVSASCSGQIGEGRKFTQTNQYFTLGSSPDLQPSKLTVSFWVKRTGDWNNQERIFFEARAGNWGSNGWVLYFVNTNALILVVDGGAGFSHSYGNSTLPNNFFSATSWDYITVTFDSATQPSSAGESHPHALTEPYVKFSLHTALIVQPSVSLQVTREQIRFCPAERCVPTIRTLFASFP